VIASIHSPDQIGKKRDIIILSPFCRSSLDSTLAISRTQFHCKRGASTMTEIDVTSHDTLTLAEACRILPKGRKGSRPHLSTIIRWITAGAPARDGRRVTLAAVRCGGKWITSRAALREFAAALTPALSDTPGTPPRTPGQRQRATARAARELEKLGI
jgi:hypothetical protein